MNTTVPRISPQTSTGLLVAAGAMTSVTIDAQNRKVLEVRGHFVLPPASGAFTMGLGCDLIKCQAVQAKVPLARGELRRIKKATKTAYDDYLWECTTYHEKDSLYQTLIVSTSRRAVCKIIKMLTVRRAYRQPLLLRSLEPAVSALIRLLPRIPEDQALVLLDDADSETLLFYIFRDHLWTFIISLSQRNRFDAVMPELRAIWVVDPALINHVLLASYPVQQHPVLTLMDIRAEEVGTDRGASRMSQIMAYALACGPLVLHHAD